MKFKVVTTLKYKALSPGTLVLNIKAINTPQQTILEETFLIAPYFKLEEFQSQPGENTLIKFEITIACTVNISYHATVESNYSIAAHENTGHVKVMDLGQRDFQYLFPSRYCQSDKLYRFANNKFKKDSNPFLQVIEITNWINENVEYQLGSTDAHTSAYDTVTEQAGVCRDFAHLGIALCRALTIPARYFTGYAYQLEPQDFHACFEAYLGGKWIIFDATKLAPLNGLVKIATGRDATDTALANIFGNIIFEEVNVSCRALDNFQPIFYQAGEYTGIAL